MVEFQRCIRFLPKLILSPQGHQQNLSLGVDPIRQCWAVLPAWQYFRQSLQRWMCEIKRDKRLSHAPVDLVIDRASLFTDQKMSGQPIRAKYKHFKTICEHTFDNSPTYSSSSCLKWWSSEQGLETLYNCSVFLFATSQWCFNAFFEHVLPMS